MSAPPVRVAYLVGPERLEWRREAMPAPAAGEIVLAVGAAVTCGTDLKVFRQGGHARMLRAPCPFGHEVAGTVAAVGAGVTRWRIGDRVAVANSAPCLGCDHCRAGRENLCRDLHYLNGAFADALRIPARFVERSVHALPASLPFATAALAEPLACVLHGFDLCARGAAEAAFVLGAGPIGLLWTARLARAGWRVTLGDPHAERLEVGRELGAARTVTVARERDVEGVAAGFALTVDCTASPQGVARCLGLAAAGGTACAFAGPPTGATVALDLHDLHYGERRLVGAYHYRPADYVAALALLAQSDFDAGRLLTATRPLEDLGWALAAMGERRALKVALVP